MRRLFAAHAEACRTGRPVEEVLGEAADRGLTRRSFLAMAGAAVATTRFGGGPPRNGAPAPRIVIVGAGLGGIRCAHRLWTGRPRVASTVYEADATHLGGRCWSLRGYFSAGRVGEHGGAFVNSEHRAIRSLASRLGLEEEVVDGGALPTGSEVFWVDGARYTYAEANADWSAAYPAFRRAVRAAPWPQRYNAFTAEGKRLDHLSVPDWLDEIGVAAGSRFGQLMQSNVLSEYGGEPVDQPALNLLYLLASNSRNSLDPIAGGDEKYHVVGGNDQIVSRMVAQLPPEAIRQGYALVALKENGNRTYTCTFASGAVATEVKADHVVLALPFSTLRDVDLTRANFSPLKMLAIQTLGMGQNAKLHVELSRKTWPALGHSGPTYTGPNEYQVAWDDSVPIGARGAPAILLGFPGGDVGRSRLTGAAHGPAPAGDVDWFLAQVERLFPGTRAAATGVAWEDHWSADSWHRGAYSYWRLGQYTSFAGYEGVREGNVHFAGEHTDPENQGFLNGAVVSGERVAREILRRL
jgi:monoamine oxidase